LHVVAGVLVVGLMVVMLLVTSGRALWPATEVEVRPAVFVREAAQEGPVGAGRHSGEQPGSRRSGSSGRTVQAPGWLEADPFYVAATALADGVVEEVLALEGEAVEAGQVVAELVKEDAELALERARGELGVAEGQLGILRADLDAAKTDWENPVERERAVATAEAALAETRAELAQLPALIEVQRANLERLKEERDRARSASAGGAVSDIEVVILEKQAEAQAAMLESHIKREAILEAKASREAAELKAAERNFELRVSEKRALDAAQAAVRRGEAMVREMQAKEAEAELRLERMTVRSPISGYVLRRVKVRGDKVMLGMDDPHSAHIVHVYDPERLQVRVDVPLADAAHVFAGQACEVVVDVLPETVFKGEVLRVTHEADLQKNTLEVKVRVVDPSPLLKPEMLTRVKFLPEGGGAASGGRASGEDGPSPVLVRAECFDGTPPSAGGASRVWVVRGRRGDVGRIAPTDVTVDVREEPGVWRVRGDVHPGDLLVVMGAAGGLKDGQRVRVTSAKVMEGGSL